MTAPRTRRPAPLAGGSRANSKSFASATATTKPLARPNTAARLIAAPRGVPLSVPLAALAARPAKLWGVQS